MYIYICVYIDKHVRGNRTGTSKEFTVCTTPYISPSQLHYPIKEVDIQKGDPATSSIFVNTLPLYYKLSDTFPLFLFCLIHYLPVLQR